MDGLTTEAGPRPGVPRLAASRVLALVAALVIAPGIGRADCLDCHGDRDIAAAGSSLYVDRDVLSHSIHGMLDCTDCHTTAATADHPGPLPKVDCGDCHADEAAAYQHHGFRAQHAGDRFPDCSDCHGTHDILPASDPRSKTHPDNLPRTCGRCHEDRSIVGPAHIPMTTPVAIYEKSVHARRTAGGGLVATCIDCHSTEGTAHAILAPIDPTSTIYHFNITNTCGRCHQHVAAEYAGGVHGQAAAKGETDVPICIDCHGAHAILPVADPASRVSPTRVSLTVCGPCHENEQLNLKYGMPTQIMQSWRHSYHGLKSTDGDPRVANCASCHRAHLILPPGDPKSSIAPANVQATCSGCHPSISPEIARIEIHKERGIFLNATGRMFRSIYIVAIIVIIGLMVVHWLIDLSKRIRVLNHGEQVLRMHRNELWQHTLLMVTFTVLAITGFAFHYSGSWWARWLFGWPGGFTVRRLIHLVAAVLFVGTAVWHMVYLFGRRGRGFMRDIFPRVGDFRQFFETMAYDLGLRRERPRFGRFSYIEKAEYWALVWGTVVMIVTGFGLWFGTTTESLFAVGAVGVMLVIHFYEAVLAGLAIFIWHLYSTIFNPPVYPNNPSWYTGKMPLGMFREEHPDDPALATAMEPPPPPPEPQEPPETPEAVPPAEPADAADPGTAGSEPAEGAAAGADADAGTENEPGGAPERGDAPEENAGPRDA